eukprot:1160185-Pelagomonas_calceolata.AAC.15
MLPWDITARTPKIVVSRHHLVGRQMQDALHRENTTLVEGERESGGTHKTAHSLRAVALARLQGRGSEVKLTGEELQGLRQEMAQQEVLIQGFQQENVAAMQRIKVSVREYDCHTGNRECGCHAANQGECARMWLLAANHVSVQEYDCHTGNRGEYLRVWLPCSESRCAFENVATMQQIRGLFERAT